MSLLGNISSGLQKAGEGLYDVFTGKKQIVNGMNDGLSTISKNSLNGGGYESVADAISSVTSPIAETYNAVTEPITHNQENFELQKSELDYQKKLQQQIFNREDTAIQRAAADLEAAGLSKTLAAGSGASSGSVVSTKAPQGVDNIGALGVMASVVNQMANVSHTKAETKRLNLSNEENAYNFAKAKQLGIPTNMLNNEAFGSYYVLNKLWDNVKDSAIGSESTNTLASAKKSVVETLSTASDWLTGKKSYLEALDHLKKVNGTGEATPNPKAFNDYSSYAKACRFAGIDCFDYDQWKKIRFGKVTSTVNKSSSGGTHGGRSGSF